jgi:hypothetical protein
MPHEDTQLVRGVRTELRPLSESPGQRRALDERLLLRVPTIYRLFANAFMRLPPRSRLRRLVLTRRIRQAYTAQGRRDFEVVLAGWDPEEVIDFGEKFLVTAQQSGHGSGSGVAVSEPIFQLFTLRRGLVIRQEDFRERSDALEAAAPRK